MKKTIKLIDNLEYDEKYLEKKDNDGNLLRDDNYRFFNKMTLERNTYQSEDIVKIDDKLIFASDLITNNFKNTFISRGREATEEQIYFAKETAKVVLGEFKDNIICVDPAPCGFGKSTIKLEIMKYLCEQYKNNSLADGVIIVGDRLADLRELQNDLGKYGSKYTYLLESWNEEICENKSIKMAKPKMCYECSSTTCKIKIQAYKQTNFPILLITNARLKEFGGGISRYSKWDNGERKILLIDERPQIMDTVKVNKELLNEIDTFISNLTYEEMKDKTELLCYWKEIIDKIENIMKPLRQEYKRFIVSNSSNINVCMDNKGFMELWDKYMGNDFKRELNNIHTVLTKGGFYVCECNKEFISTIGTKNLRENYKSFKTIIFDGSALYDPQYLSMYSEDEMQSDLKFLYIPNSRTYNNVNITTYTAHKINKSEFGSKKYLLKAVAEFVKSRNKKGITRYDYVVTYKEQASILGRLLGGTLRIPTNKDGQTFYFGGTKGSNNMEKCTSMIQIGWDTLPDYEVAIMWLSCCIGVWDKLLTLCLNKDNAIKYSEILQKVDRDEATFQKKTYSSGYKNYKFGYETINQFQYLDTVSKFYQEIHRTKLRDYNYTESIDVTLFQAKPIIYDMVKELLPKCNFVYNKETLSEFQLAKDESFTKSDGTKTDKQKLIEWFNKWDGKDAKVSTIRSECNISSKRWEKLKQEQSIKIILSNLNTNKRGYYSR